MRGDKVSDHFKKFAKLAVLDEAKKLDVPLDMTNGLKHINELLVDDEKQRNHTLYLLSNGYSSTNLPTWKSEGFKKSADRPLPVGYKGFFKIPRASVSSTVTQPSNNSDSEDDNTKTGLVTNALLSKSLFLHPCISGCIRKY